MRQRIPIILTVMILAGCENSSDPVLLGTLERDRIATLAEASERIVSIDVREGDEVKAGQALLSLDPKRVDESIVQARADARGAQAALDELLRGRRKELIDVARAQLSGATARVTNSKLELDRVAKIRERKLNAQVDLDRAKTALSLAEADRDVARANLAELLNGSRIENIELAEATLAARQSTIEQLELTRSRYTSVAAVDGRVDSIPFKLGDQPAKGAVLASLLSGPVYARIYVPASQRNTLKVGSRCTIRITGSEPSFAARIRSLRSDPAFTPYFALSGDDASRLAYRAEMVLEEGAAPDLPVGQPVQAECAADSASPAP